MRQRWLGEDLRNLMQKDIDELVKLYPEQKRANLIRRKQEYKQKLGEVSDEGVRIGTKDRCRGFVLRFL